MKRIFLLLIGLAVVFQPSSATAQEQLFPQITGWKFAQEETVYTPANLYDVIDGAADLFLEYDFIDLHIVRYTQAELEIKVELYRHGSSVDAFGMFSQERFADYHFINLGVQGYLEKGALNFLAGPYYVKISTIQESAAAQDGMLSVATAVESHLKQSKAWPSMLAAFPEEKRKVYSEQYIAKNFLGYSTLNGAFVASFDDGTPFKAFVIRLGTPEDARKTLTDFEKALPKSATYKEKGGKTELLDSNTGRVELVLKGNYIIGVVSSNNGTSHDTFLDTFGKRILSLK